jgi:preprotein translocase subunit YajC
MFAAAKSSSSTTLLIVYVVIFAAIYFFYLRPRSKRQKAQRAAGRQVNVGDKAQTIGGLIGTVVKSDGEIVTLRCASGAELDFIPSAIARRIDPVTPPSSDTEEGDAK